MTTHPVEPNPPSRRSEDFPQTNTIPDGWVMEELMAVYNRNGSVYDRGVEIDSRDHTTPVPTTGKVNGGGTPDGGANVQARISSLPSTKTEQDGLFARRLNPFPSDRDLTGKWL